PYSPPIPIDLAAQNGAGGTKSIAVVLNAEQEGIRIEDYLQRQVAGAKSAG
ncbi:MAG: hypothetical protein HZB35_08005, partial [Nitrospirae bacterium]|nr:hypothetical protein [Nitrospirota bacterium]